MMVTHPNPRVFSKHPHRASEKMVLIDIEVIDAPLDYNILLGHSYMYMMKASGLIYVSHHDLPHNGKVITMVDQLTHYEPHPTMNLDNILPLIGAQLEISPVMEMGPGIFQDPSLLGTYQGDPPCIPPSDSSQVCTITYVMNHRTIPSVYP
jgi:hypothetical protein